MFGQSKLEQLVDDLEQQREQMQAQILELVQERDAARAEVERLKKQLKEQEQES